MSGHSFLPPSSAKAWRYCPMWPTMNRLFPQEATPESIEGNDAHWVAWQMLAGNPIVEGMPAPGGTIIIDEMIDGAELLIDTVRQRMHGQFTLNVEKPVNIPRISEHCWGTPDLWGYSQVHNVLEVIDYKFGHRFVDEFENDQGAAYIAGIIDQLTPDSGGLFDQVLRVNFTIVQPRCFYRGSPVRTHSFMASDIRGHINVLNKAAYLALQTEPEAITNSECINCPGRHACAANQLAGYHDAEFSVKSSPIDLTPEQASLELRIMERALDRLTSRVEGMREQVTAYVRQGYRVPFHYLEQGQARQQWTVPIDQIVAIGQLMGINLAKPGVVTPKQALKSGIDEAVIMAYSIKPSGSFKLVPDNPADVRKVFGINN